MGETSLLSIFITALLIQNVALYYLLGMCPFVALSRSLTTAFGMGAAVIFVVTLTSSANWVIYQVLAATGSQIDAGDIQVPGSIGTGTVWCGRVGRPGRQTHQGESRQVGRDDICDVDTVGRHACRFDQGDGVAQDITRGCVITRILTGSHIQYRLLRGVYKEH